MNELFGGWILSFGTYGTVRPMLYKYLTYREWCVQRGVMNEYDKAKQAIADKRKVKNG